MLGSKIIDHASSIILSLHPWVAKGPEYLSLDRQDKAAILWAKITENNEIGVETPKSELMKLTIANSFDEFGDEFDCRMKAIHQQGNVGKAIWVSKGEHNYTGIFKGGDTGFVRLSAQTFVNKPPLEPGAFSLMPTHAVKFLRDHIDSANAVANSIPQFGTYDFFQNDFITNVLDVGVGLDQIEMNAAFHR